MSAVCCALFVLSFVSCRLLVVGCWCSLFEVRCSSFVGCCLLICCWLVCCVLFFVDVWCCVRFLVCCFVCKLLSGGCCVFGFQAVLVVCFL